MNCKCKKSMLELGRADQSSSHNSGKLYLRFYGCADCGRVALKSEFARTPYEHTFWLKPE